MPWLLPNNHWVQPLGAKLSKPHENWVILINQELSWPELGVGLNSWMKNDKSLHDELESTYTKSSMNENWFNMMMRQTDKTNRFPTMFPRVLTTYYGRVGPSWVCNLKEIRDTSRRGRDSRTLGVFDLIPIQTKASHLSTHRRTWKG